VKNFQKGLPAKISKETSAGFGALEGLLLVVMLAMIGGTGWYVLHSKDQANHAYSTTANLKTLKQDKTPTSRAGVESANAVKTSFSKLPVNLQSVIIDENQKQAPDCVANGKLVDSDGKPANPAVTFASIGSAIAPIGCDGQQIGLFAVDKENQWHYIEATQENFSCAAIATNPVPKKLLKLGAPSTDCIVEDTSTGQTRTYDANENKYFF
jgi:hypothetical protein